MKRFWITTIISLFFTSLGVSQDVLSTFQFAEKLYSDGQYRQASHLYKRVLFFTDDTLLLTTHQKLADCYFKLGMPDESLFHYRLALNNVETDSIRTEIHLRRVLIYILTGLILEAKTELFSVETFYSEDNRHRFFVFEGIVHIENQEYDAARISFYSALKPNDTVGIRVIDSLFSSFNPYTPSPKTAKLLSILFPGMGQLYCGDYKNALNSLLLTGALTAVFIYTSANYSLINATLAIFPYYQRYYLGGVYSAERIASEKQMKRKQEFIANIIQTIIST